MDVELDADEEGVELRCGELAGLSPAYIGQLERGRLLECFARSPYSVAGCRALIGRVERLLDGPAC